MLNAGSHHPIVLLEDFSRSARSFRFDGLETIIAAHTADEVVAVMAEVERFVAQGRHAAGFVSYEAASALNPDLGAAVPGELPLAWFAIFAERLECTGEADSNEAGECRLSDVELAVSRQDYGNAVGTIRRAIAAGDTYQVNYTTRQRFNVTGDPFCLYRRMCRNQQAPFCAWLDIGTHRILSASPELFFSLENGRITMRPMKGTAPRLPAGTDDRCQREQLATSAKDRAENLMIVDLVRNDLARITETGTVKVPSLFDVETFPTVHQMTSTITARIRPGVGLTDIFRALFPCGSVTGAPKRRTMEIISDLETAPRGIYCGAIGYLSPGGEAAFSVAIRTAVIENTTGRGELGIGSGITWDSDAGSEYRECLDKGAFLSRDSTPFQLIETLRHDRDGYLLLERHLERLAVSAAYFGFRFDADSLRVRLDALGKELHGIHKVRVLLAADGAISMDVQPLTEAVVGDNPLPVAISQQRVDSGDPFLYHKTTRRSLYDSELRTHPGCYDVIFRNERDEVTEGSYTTVVISLQGKLLTPALHSGLLPGVLRQELIEAGAIREEVLTLDELHRADRIWLVNSVRGWRECIIADNRT